MTFSDRVRLLRPTFEQAEKAQAANVLALIKRIEKGGPKKWNGKKS